ncbi:HBL244Wp [Eremothecium sinecaudum]|uniref:HBL244Wp n=1 Tax=Eremothecium sinecaudum TaxID=45286 RepID=A0A109UW57_9SACH|nr:HBL244Wp [Eremothecium sinecaudum]AMD18658.1 HBL244Wp [Eremothecium sinecaudum]
MAYNQHHSDSGDDSEEVKVIDDHEKIKNNENLSSKRSGTSGLGSSDVERNDWEYDGKYDGIRLKRDLKARHMSMIAIGGSLGTGLLIGTGTSLSLAGPGAVFIGYCIMGVVVYIVMTCLGEMAAYIPLDGYTSYATRYADPALGFAVGYAYLFKYLILTPNQLTAGALVMQYWVPPGQVNPGVWITIFLVVIVTINIVGVRFFGEFEFWLSSFKVLVMIVVIILLFLIMLGVPSGDRLGFRYWSNPGAFNAYKSGSVDIEGPTGRLVSFMAVFVYALFAYLGTELCGIVAAETHNPRRNVPRAIKLTLYRIIVFYACTIFLLGMCVAYNDPGLLQASNATTSAAASPYVVAIKNAGIPVLHHIFNACVLIFVFSASNSDLYVGSRTLYGLAIDHKISKVFAYTNSWGVPYNALIACTVCCFLAYMNISNSAAKMFKYFVNVSSIFGLLSWITILITYDGFYKAFRAQGIDRSTLSYAAPMQPWAGRIALGFCCFVALMKNYTVFLGPRFDYQNFITGYIGIPVYIICFVGYKVIYKTKWIKPEDVDLYSFKGPIDMEEEQGKIEEAEHQKILNEKGWTWKWLYEKIFGWIF